MSVLLIKVLHTAKSSGKVTNVTNLVNMQSGRGLSIKNNKLIFTVKNSLETFNSEEEPIHEDVIGQSSIEFQEDDVIKFFIKYTDDFADVEDVAWAKNNVTEPSSTYLKGVYFVVDRSVDQTISTNPIKITCVDKTYILFNRLLAENFPLTSTTGTTTSTTTNKLVDSSAKFLNNSNVGMLVKNTTDGTQARLTAIDSDITISLSEDIFTSGENYELQWTAPSILQKVVRFSSENPIGEFSGTGSDSGAKYDVDAKMETDEGGFIQDVRKSTYEDGTSNTNTNFPGKSISKVWKAVYEWADELSQIEFLNSTNELQGLFGEKLVYGRQFLLWVDENNRVHWKETSNTVNKNIEIGVTPSIYSYQLTKSGFDVINFVVFRGGEDFFGNGTLDYVIDTSIDANIKKMHVVAMTDIAAKLIESEIAKGNLVSNTSGSFTYSGNRYNRNGSVVAEWDGELYASDSTYNAALRNEINRLGKNRSRAIISGRNSSRFKGKISTKGANYNPGDLLKVTNKKTGQIDELIRVHEVREQIDNSIWQTNLEIEQDDEAIISIED